LLESILHDCKSYDSIVRCKRELKLLILLGWYLLNLEDVTERVVESIGLRLRLGSCCEDIDVASVLAADDQLRISSISESQLLHARHLVPEDLVTCLLESIIGIKDEYVSFITADEEVIVDFASTEGYFAVCRQVVLYFQVLS